MSRRAYFDLKGRLLRLKDLFSSVLREHGEVLVLLLVVSILVRYFLVSTYFIPSRSMEPTLVKGDIVFGIKTTFGTDLPWIEKWWKGRSPQINDLVVYKCQRGLCLHRVVALPGDRIEVVHQRLILNGQLCQYEKKESDSTLEETCDSNSRLISIENYAEKEKLGPFVLYPDEYFVMSDRRSDSFDSRKWGAVSKSNLVAWIPFVVVSFDWGASKDQAKMRWNRTLVPIN